MKFDIPLAIRVHYTVEFNLECCKIYVPDMDPNNILKILKIIIRRLKIEICFFQHTILMKFGRPLDFSKASDLLFSILFVDDTSVFIEGTAYNSIIKDMNTELVKVDKWLKSDKLSVNI